jgi:hypothetical protein
MDVGAVWDDLRIGVEHLTRWERIAVVTDLDWLQIAVRAFGFLMPGTHRSFPLDEADEARRWIAADA